MTLFEEIEPVVKKKKELDAISVNYLNNIIENVKCIPFSKEVEIFTCTSIKTLEGKKKVGIRAIITKCKGNIIDKHISYNYPSDKNRSETIVLINALQIAKFINNKLKLDVVVYNNSEYALDFITIRKYIKNVNKDLDYFLSKKNFRDLDFVKIKKIHRKDNMDRLHCKEFCQIKNIK